MSWATSLIVLCLLFICYVVGSMSNNKPKSSRFTKENDNHFHCTGTRFPKDWK